MRLRITFSKTGALRYIGHLDLHRLWERTIRRAGLPLAYSQGFHPSPKIQLASALPLGFLGRAEVVDVWLNDSGEGTPRPTRDLLQDATPPGLTILDIEEVDARLPALQTQVISAEYVVTLLDPVEAALLSRNISVVLEARSLPRQRREKAYDLRPLIESLSLLPEDGSGTQQIAMCLASREGATGRPEEVLDSLGIPFETTRVERTRLILETALK